MDGGADSLSVEEAANQPWLRSLRSAWPDLLLASALAILAVGYLGSFPNNVRTPPDEAHVLHQAKRLLEGEVLYRDLFDIATPLWTYLVAGVFWLFGTTLTTARLTIAVVHGAALAMIFLLCRRLPVRRELAVIVALAYLVLCQPVYPVANRHWLVTLVGLVLLYGCLGRQNDRRISLLGGILVGVLISTHQQRGVGLGLAFVTWMFTSNLLERRFGAVSVVSLRTAVANFAVGVIAVVAPLLALVSWRAGMEPVWYALIVHPLTHYLGTIQTTWGHAGPYVAQSTVPVLLRSLPIAVVAVGLRLAFLTRQRRGLAESRSLLPVLIFCVFAALSIEYFPDLTHLAFIAPFFFVAVAWLGEWGFSLLPSRAAAIAARAAVALFVIAASSSLIGRWRYEHRVYSVPRTTAFGRIDFARVAAARFDAFERLLAGERSPVIYVYPISSFLYLTLGARNPTRFEFFFPGSSTTMAQAEEVLTALRTENVEYVYFPIAVSRRGDVVVRYVDENFEPVDKRRTIWRRK